MKFVSEIARPKKRGETIVTGPPLAGFTKTFSENVNNNVVPKISSLWLVIIIRLWKCSMFPSNYSAYSDASSVFCLQSVEELEGRRACDTATEVYMSSLERAESPEEVSFNSCNTQQSLGCSSKINY